MSGVSLALVHHANQLLVGEGYPNREGLGEIVAGYGGVLDVHERHGVPMTLHLSGTLIEALAWSHPRFLARLRRLADDGLVELMGGTYAENVMPVFPGRFNRRQLLEAQRLTARHLDRPGGTTSGCWVPERVWSTPRLAGDIAAAGYRYVLLDDRLLVAPADRAAFDARGPRDDDGEGSLPDPDALARLLRPYLIAQGAGLAVVPISRHLRYWVPPREPAHWLLLDELLEAAGTASDHPLLVYADDLERPAGVGGWEPGLERYAAFVSWLLEHPGVRTTRLDLWLAAHPPAEERAVEPGTFFELVREWGAGEDYAGWWRSPAWRPYRRRMDRATRAVEDAEEAGADPRLLALAWKHLLASAHETAWHDPEPGGRRTPAKWARAVASHAASALVMAKAAAWFAQPDRSAAAELVDVDEDGEDEAVLRSAELYAVVSPRHGGRLVELYHATGRGAVLAIGNPTDHWNWQEQRNRYMDRPPNHPGALADVGLEHVVYAPAGVDRDDDHAIVRLVPTAGRGRPVVAAKTMLLAAGAPALVAQYELAATGTRFTTELCLSPDYLGLLREGRAGLQRTRGVRWRGAEHADVHVWAARAEGEPTAWTRPARPTAGHGVNLRLAARSARFRVVVGCGPATDEGCRRILAWSERHLPAPVGLEVAP
jgi:hypothetical protein